MTDWILNIVGFVFIVIPYILGLKEFMRIVWEQITMKRDPSEKINEQKKGFNETMDYLKAEYERAKEKSIREQEQKEVKQ